MSPDATANPDTGPQPPEAISTENFADAYARAFGDEENPETDEQDGNEVGDAEEESDGEDQDTGEQDEPETEDDEPEAKDEPQYEVALSGGLKVKVPVSELIQGYQRQKDYTRKTTELAEQRRAHEAETAEVRGMQEKAAELLNELLDKYLEPEEQIDWQKLAADDPLGYQEKHASWLHRQQQHRAASEAKARLQAERERAAAEERQKRGAAEAKRFMEATGLPQQKAYEAYVETIRGAAQEYSLTKDDFERLDLSAPMVLALKDALAYRQLQKAKPATEKRANAAPRILKPGQQRPATANLATKLEKAKGNLARTGSADAFADWYATRAAAPSR